MAWKRDEGTGETANACAGYSSRGDVVCEGVRQGVGVGGVDRNSDEEAGTGRKKGEEKGMSCEVR